MPLKKCSLDTNAYASLGKIRRFAIFENQCTFLQTKTKKILHLYCLNTELGEAF